MFYTSFLNAGREGLQSPDRMEKNWYVVHTYSGYENKVKANLEKRVESMGMQDKIFRVVVPEEEETDIKNGKKKVVKKKVFPGYVLVEIVMTDDSWYVVATRRALPDSSDQPVQAQSRLRFFLAKRKPS